MKKLCLSVLLGIGLAGSVSASLLINEGFETGDFTGGTGLGAWTRNGNNGWTVLVTDGAAAGRVPDFTGVDSGDYWSRRGAATSNAEMHSTISADMDATSTIYFSMLINPYRVNAGNNFQMILGTDALIQGNGPGAVMMTAGGEGIGFGLNNTTLHAYIYDESGGTTTGAESTGSITVANNAAAAETTYMIVGKIDWGATDTLNLYNITDLSAPLPTTAFATIAGDLDETAFNMLAIGDKQNASIDEIRFGTEVTDVIPEPATIGMLVASAMGILFIRRRLMI